MVIFRVIFCRISQNTKSLWLYGEHKMLLTSWKSLRTRSHFPESRASTFCARSFEWWLSFLATWTKEFACWYIWTTTWNLNLLKIFDLREFHWNSFLGSYEWESEQVPRPFAQLIWQLTIIFGLRRSHCLNMTCFLISLQAPRGRLGSVSDCSTAAWLFDPAPFSTWFGSLHLIKVFWNYLLQRFESKFLIINIGKFCENLR